MLSNLLLKSKIIFSFCKMIWVFTFLLSLILWSTVYFQSEFSMRSFLSILLLIKILTNAAIFGIFSLMKSKNVFLFYNNLGISKTFLWAITFSVDLFIFPFSILLF
jgi:hypothetical protein